ncbi:hypothetical protein NN561_018615 [Cricetulus griseus]
MSGRRNTPLRLSNSSHPLGAPTLIPDLGEFDLGGIQNPLRQELSLPSGAGLTPRSTPHPAATGFGRLTGTDLPGASSAGLPGLGFRLGQSQCSSQTWTCPRTPAAIAIGVGRKGRGRRAFEERKRNKSGIK